MLLVLASWQFMITIMERLLDRFCKVIVLPHTHFWVQRACYAVAPNHFVVTNIINHTFQYVNVHQSEEITTFAVTSTNLVKLIFCSGKARKHNLLADFFFFLYITNYTRYQFPSCHWFYHPLLFMPSSIFDVPLVIFSHVKITYDPFLVFFFLYLGPYCHRCLLI